MPSYNEPVFPTHPDRVTFTGDPRDGPGIERGECGLSKKEYFTLKILQSLLSNPAVVHVSSNRITDTLNDTHKDVIRLAKNMAYETIDELDKS